MWPVFRFRNKSYISIYYYNRLIFEFIFKFLICLQGGWVHTRRLSHSVPTDPGSDALESNSRPPVRKTQQNISAITRKILGENQNEGNLFRKSQELTHHSNDSASQDKSGAHVSSIPLSSQSPNQLPPKNQNSEGPNQLFPLPLPSLDAYSQKKNHLS